MYAQIGKVQEVTDQRTGITFALDMQSPRTVRTCHSVGTSRSREAGINSNRRRRLPRLCKIHLGPTCHGKPEVSLSQLHGRVALLVEAFVLLACLLEAFAIARVNGSARSALREVAQLTIF